MKRCCYLSETLLRLFLATAVAVSFSTGLQAQIAPAKQWDKTFGGNDEDRLWVVRQTSDGGYILGGTTESEFNGDKTEFSRGFNDYWVVRTDASGNKLWDKTFGGNSYDYLYDLQQTSDGGFILGGDSRSGISGEKSETQKGISDFWIIKLDASGNKQWDKTIGGNGFSSFFSLQQTADGGYITGGLSNSDIGGDKTQNCRGNDDFWVVKLDNYGNKQWDKTIGGNDIDVLWHLRQTADGGYILGGYSDSEISGDKTQANKGLRDFWIVKLDATGNKLWDKTFGGGEREHLFNVQEVSGGGYILGGYSESGKSGDKSEAGKGGRDCWVVRLNANGNKIWDKTLGGNKDDNLLSLQQTTDGGFILGGTSFSGNSGDKSEDTKGNDDYWVVKLDAFGNKQWDKTIGGNSSDQLASVEQTSDGGFILGGTSYSDISSDKSQNSKGGFDYWIVKLESDLNKPGISSALSVSIAPNPGRGNFYVHLSGLTTDVVEVTVSDILGRMVLKKQLPVINKHIFDELALPVKKGMYLLRVKAGDQTTTRKIVVE